MRPTTAIVIKVERLKGSWNKVRDRSTDSETRTKLIEDMTKAMTGYIAQVTLRHDAARIVQTVLQFGNQEQKDLMLNELVGKTVEIAKTPYGHFTILKAVSYCTKPEQQRKLINSLRGHFVALGTNVIGARTVESILQLYPHTLTRNLKAEFYGSVRAYNLHLLLVKTNTLTISSNTLHYTTEILYFASGSAEVLV